MCGWCFDRGGCSGVHLDTLRLLDLPQSAAWGGDSVGAGVMQRLLPAGVLLSVQVPGFPPAPAQAALERRHLSHWGSAWRCPLLCLQASMAQCVGPTMLLPLLLWLLLSEWLPFSGPLASLSQTLRDRVGGQEGDSRKSWKEGRRVGKRLVLCLLRSALFILPLVFGSMEPPLSQVPSCYSCPRNFLLPIASPLPPLLPFLQPQPCTFSLRALY